MSFVTTDEFSVMVIKILSQGLMPHELTAYLSLFNLFYLTQQIMVILSRGCKPDNFESHNFDNFES